MTSAKSEKQDKQLASRLIRRITKRNLQNGLGEEIFPSKKVVDSWNWNKDGKQWYSKKLLERNPRLMRK